MTNMMKSWGLLVVLVLFTGCTGQKPADTPKPDAPKAARSDHGDHGDHGGGPHGGTIVELGKSHGEFAVDHAKKEATVYILDGDAKKPEAIAADKLLLSLKTPALQLELKPLPQDGDPKGKSSRFVGTHEAFAKEQPFEGMVSVVIDGKPYFGEFKEVPHEKLPNIGGTAAERELHLTPGGIYTAADIQANGNVVPSVKYKDISWPHDDNLKPGDKVCPVTVNKADERCLWTVNGKSYQFCCTPCLDKFVKWAKKEPEKIKEPEAYIHK